MEAFVGVGLTTWEVEPLVDGMCVVCGTCTGGVVSRGGGGGGTTMGWEDKCSWLLEWNGCVYSVVAMVKSGSKRALYKAGRPTVPADSTI